MNLYINCCTRAESRTDRMAKLVLKKLGDKYEEVKPGPEGLTYLDEERLNKRTALIEKGDYDDEMFKYARQFAEADNIVIGAPYWDFSFPAELKLFIENIYITGLVSRYNEQGIPEGLCKARKLYYVTTAGGPFDPRFSYDYIKEMATLCFGIGEVELIKAENLDIFGNDPEQLLIEAEKKYDLI